MTLKELALAERFLAVEKVTGVPMEKPRDYTLAAINFYAALKQSGTQSALGKNMAAMVRLLMDSEDFDAVADVAASVKHCDMTVRNGAYPSTIQPPLSVVGSRRITGGTSYSVENCRTGNVTEVLTWINPDQPYWEGVESIDLWGHELSLPSIYDHIGGLLSIESQVSIKQKKRAGTMKGPDEKDVPMEISKVHYVKAPPSYAATSIMGILSAGERKGIPPEDVIKRVLGSSITKAESLIYLALSANAGSGIGPAQARDYLNKAAKPALDLAPHLADLYNSLIRTPLSLRP